MEVRAQGVTHSQFLWQAVERNLSRLLVTLSTASSGFFYGVGQTSFLPAIAIAIGLRSISPNSPNDQRSNFRTPPTQKRCHVRFGSLADASNADQQCPLYPQRADMRSVGINVR